MGLIPFHFELFLAISTVIMKTETACLLFVEGTEWFIYSAFSTSFGLIIFHTVINITNNDVTEDNQPKYVVSVQTVSFIVCECVAWI